MYFFLRYLLEENVLFKEFTVVALYATSLGSIHGRVIFLIDGFPSTVRQMPGNLGLFMPGYHLAIDHLNHRSSAIANTGIG